MFKIGIVGSDNSHAEAFSRLCNLPDANGDFAFPDFRVTGIFGLEEQRTREVAQKGAIGYIAEKPEDLLGKVDAVMVVFRHGDLHLPYALPFIRAGVPVWLDKPIVIKDDDARALVDAAKNTLITGGSTCKYTPDIQMLKLILRSGRVGALCAADINFPATLKNEYGGIYFYGAHLAEMTLEAFGYDPVSVVATEAAGAVTATVKYPSFQVTMHFVPDCAPYHVTLYGSKGSIVRDIDITDCYRFGFERFADMLRTGKQPFPTGQILKPVRLLNAVLESVQSDTPVTL